MDTLYGGLSRKSGMLPGAIVHVGERREAAVGLSLIRYDGETLEETTLDGIEQAFPINDRKGVNWINADGVHDVRLIEELGRRLDLHPLLLEDIVHTRQRPKLEDFEEYTYVVARMLYQRPARDRDGEVEIEGEQVSIVVGPSWVLTFLEDPGDVFDPVRRRLRENKGRLRKLGADYLAYSLLDVVVDNYFAVLERLGEEVDRVEGELLSGPAEAHVEEIRALKRAMIQMRAAVWPLRDVIAGLLRGDSKLFKKTTLLYLRDVHDHLVRVAEIGEALRETIAGMMDIYMSSVSNRLNEVMKVLTIIATIFIPLTFIVGVYGMNFHHMPELAWRWGYWAVWGVMVGIGGALLVYFKRKRWF